MKFIRLFKNGLLTFLSMLLVFPKTVSADSQPQTRADTDIIPNQEESKVLEFSQEELIQALKEMHRDPKEITVVSAMCYEMMMPPEEVEFQCPDCGKKTIHKYGTNSGVLTQELPYIKRSLKAIPYKIAINSKGICSYCSKGKDNSLIMDVTCFSCGKQFLWNVRTQDDVDALHWLYMRPPFKEIDGHYLGFWTSTTPDGQDNIKKGAQYILEHVFCPECRKKINL